MGGLPREGLGGWQVAQMRMVGESARVPDLAVRVVVEPQAGWAGIEDWQQFGNTQPENARLISATA